MSAWEEVETGVIVKCFKHVGMHPEEKDNTDEDDDPFAGEDLLDLDEMVRKGSGDAKKIDTLTYVTVVDYDFPPYMAMLDTTDPNWRKDLLEEIIEKHTFTLEITEIRVTEKR